MAAQLTSAALPNDRFAPQAAIPFPRIEIPVRVASSGPLACRTKLRPFRNIGAADAVGRRSLAVMLGARACSSRCRSMPTYLSAFADIQRAIFKQAPLTCSSR